MRVVVGMSFEVDRQVPPANEGLHDALEALRMIEFEAPSVELAEHWGDLVRQVLVLAGS